MKNISFVVLEDTALTPDTLTDIAKLQVGIVTGTMQDLAHDLAENAEHQQFMVEWEKLKSEYEKSGGCAQWDSYRATEWEKINP